MSIETPPVETGTPEQKSESTDRRVRAQQGWLRDLLVSTPLSSDERRVIQDWLELANQ